jgi:RimJ/RimL family protein N-acetyltransferase
MTSKTIELADGNIQIRPYSAEDTSALYEAVRESIKEISVWMGWCHPDYAIEETSAFILARDEAWQSDREYTFGIFDAKTGDFLGSTGLNFVNRVHDCANLGYWVRSSCTGRGVASAAARLVARFGLESCGFQRIEILAAIGNKASQRAAEKAGALREAVLRKRLLVGGQPQDAVLYSLVAEDF